MEHTSTVHDSVTLLQQMRDKSLSSNIPEILLPFTQRNIFYEIRKAIAITIMAATVTEWNCSTVDFAN